MSIYRVQAYNTAHSSENKIHDDAVARRFGFSGALVPGVEVYAYMMHLPVERWGRAFLERGAAQCRFSNPVYDGATAEVSGRDDGEDGGAIDIDVTSAGKSCATGSARLPADAPAPPALDRFPLAPPPAMESRPAASPATLRVGAILGSIPMAASREHAAGYLHDVRETDGLYAREGLVHPGTVLRMGNLALLQNVLLGPWIHVGSAAQNFSAAKVGETLLARSRVAANYERKGHLFVELDVLVLGEGTRPLAQLRHTAIYKPRQVAEVKAQPPILT
jgi:hypothetical protein